MLAPFLRWTALPFALTGGVKLPSKIQIIQMKESDIKQGNLLFVEAYLVLFLIYFVAEPPAVHPIIANQ